METLQTNGTANPADEIWAILRESTQRHVETDRLLKESARRHEENELLMQENARRQAETDKQMQETKQFMNETFRQLKEDGKRLDKQIGDLGNKFGEMAEHTILPNLLAKFEKLGFTFTKANRTDIKDKEHNIFTDVDAFLENGEKVMCVEIKNKLKVDDIDDHIERMEKLRVYADLHNDKRAYLGAVAGVIFSESERVYALKKGFYVIEPSGETFNITEPTGKYHPHEW